MKTRGNTGWKRLAAVALLGAGLSLPVAARTMMEYGNMPMRPPETEILPLVEESVGASEEQLRSVQESDRQGQVAAPPLTVPGFENDYDDADGYEAQRTGLNSFYWLLGALVVAAALALSYTLSLRRRVPDVRRR